MSAPVLVPMKARIMPHVSRGTHAAMRNHDTLTIRAPGITMAAQRPEMRKWPTEHVSMGYVEVAVVEGVFGYHEATFFSFSDMSEPIWKCHADDYFGDNFTTRAMWSDRRVTFRVGQRTFVVEVPDTRNECERPIMGDVVMLNGFAHFIIDKTHPFTYDWNGPKP